MTSPKGGHSAGKRSRSPDHLFLAGVVALVLTLAASSFAGAGWPGEFVVWSNNAVVPWQGVDSSAVCLWSINLEGPVTSGPLVDEQGRVFLVAGGHVVALNSDGSRLWAVDAGVVSPGCISLGNASGESTELYVGTSNPRQVQCYSAATGSLLRRIYIQSIPTCPPLALAGRLFCGTEDGWIRAFRPDGCLLWSYQLGGAVRQRLSYDPSGKLYAVDVCGRAVALNPETGTPLWRRETQMAPQSPPVLGPDGSLFFSDQGGLARRIDSAGQTMWTQALGHTGGLPTVLADGRSVYSRSDGKICCLGPDGSLQWVSDVSGTGQLLQPVADGAGIIHTASGGRIVGLTSTGAPAWELDLGQGTIAAMTLPSAGKALVATDAPALALYGSPGGDGGSTWFPMLRAPQADGQDGWYVTPPQIGLDPASLDSRPPGAIVAWQATAGEKTASGILAPDEAVFTIPLEGNVDVVVTSSGCEPAALSLKVDLASPKVSVTNIAAGGSGLVATGAFSPHVLATDRHSGVGSVRMLLDGSEFSKSCSLVAGDHILRVVASDRAGNEAVFETTLRASDECSASPLNPVVAGPGSARIPAWSKWITVLVRVPASNTATISDAQLGGVAGFVAARLPARASSGYRSFVLRFPREPVALVLADQAQEGDKSLAEVTLPLALHYGGAAMGASVTMLYRR